jgi:hypothetical protein
LQVSPATPRIRAAQRHTTLTDAVYQAEQVCEIWQRLTSPHRIAVRAAMHPRLSVICSAPLPVCNRALAALKCFARGQRNFSRVMPHAYLVIRIGRRWRLLSKNGGQQWRLMTHETYNQEYRK